MQTLKPLFSKVLWSGMPRWNTSCWETWWICWMIPADPETCRWVLMILDTLLRLLPREFTQEEDGGYLQEVLDEYPNWERQVQDLHGQHYVLHARLAELRIQVAAVQTQGEISPRSRWELYEWIEQVHHHNRQETELLQTAINLEVGVGD